MTGLRCTEGRTRTDFKEIEDKGDSLVKLNPILIWKEWRSGNTFALTMWRESFIRRVIALGWAPCTQITNDEMNGKQMDRGTSKCGGECGIHTKLLGSGVHITPL